MSGFYKPLPLALLALIAVSLLTGCAKNDDELKREIFRLREQVAELNRNVTDAHVRVEELDNRLQILQSQVRNVQGMSAAQSDQSIPRNLKKVKLVPEGNSDQAYNGTASQKSGGEVPYYVIDGTAKQVQQKKQAASDEYQKALTLYKQGNYDKAVLAFDRFAADHQDSEYTDNAIFWGGVSRYEQSNFADAIKRLQNVLKIPNSNKIADALYYLGKSYQELGDSGTAQRMWEQLIEEHPESGAARKVNTTVIDQHG